MIHNEMSFLFGAAPIQGLPTNLTSIATNSKSNSGDIFGTIDTTKHDRIYKDSKTGRNNVINEVQNTIYSQDRMTKDPYIALLEYFNNMSGNGPISMALQAADFVYLKDLGVYPINRLIILRRYKDGVVVPNNLALFKERPISTVIGWVKFDEANKEMFSFNFNEKWVETSDTLDKVIQKIMKEQFGIRTEMFFPIPAWSQGFLFGMLNNMGLSKYDSKNVPTGDPNVLRTSMMREVESQSLMSELKITFETSYEQKYIDGVDPGLAFQDIIANLVRCGTSEMKFVLNGNSTTFQNLINAVQMGGNGGDTLNAWTEVGKSLIKAFTDTIGNFFGGISNLQGDVSSQYKDMTDEKRKESLNNQDTEKKRQNILNKYIKARDSATTEDGKKKWQDEIDKVNNKITFLKGDINAAWTLIQSQLTDVVKTVLAGSVYKYRWPLIGSIGVMSGLATTPWHLTVGNPFSPILNMANIVVNNVDMKFSSEMGFNDMPKRVEATIDIKMARPIGSSEINRMFNNQYGRIYSKPTTTTTDTSGNSNTSGLSMTEKVNDLSSVDIVQEGKHSLPAPKYPTSQNQPIFKKR